LSTRRRNRHRNSQQRSKVESFDKSPTAPATIHMDVKYDGGGLAKGGLVTLFVNDKRRQRIILGS
jgi:arylsulfatase